MTGNLTTYIASTHRVRLLNYLPKGLKTAEIGVFEGDFSSHILTRTEPRSLHLIDPWIHHLDANYMRDTANSQKNEQDLRFEKVLNRFDGEIKSGVVSVVREKFHDAVDKINDSKFDFVYIDAMHYEKAVYDDLIHASKIIGRNGIIGGHDFSNHPLSNRKNFGVIQAVKRFCEDTGYSPILISNERWPSYFLTKPNSDLGRQFMQSLFMSDIPMFAFPAKLIGNVKQRPIQIENAEKIITEISL